MRLKKSIIVLVALMMGLAVTGCGDNPDKEVAKVNDTVITAGQVDEYMKLYAYTQGLDISSLEGDELKKAQNSIVSDMVSMEVMKQYYDGKKEVVLPENYDATMKDNIAQIKSTTGAATYLSENGITDDTLKRFLTNQYYTTKFFTEMSTEMGDTDAKAKEYYEKNKKDYTNPQVEASHILVETEAEAKEIKKQLDEGGDFAALAKEKSTDTGSAVSGGALGYFGKGAMVAPFEEAAFSMKVGEISEPVKTDFGYHIIKVTGIKDETYEEAAQDIYYKLFDQEYEKKLEGIKKDMTIEVTGF